MQHPAWMLITLGLVIVAVGLLWLLVPTLPWLGKLPGDIAVERGNFRFFFPLTTCLLFSALLTAIAWLVRFFSR
jgi:Protein of unknown function (DUF2905)